MWIVCGGVSKSMLYKCAIIPLMRIGARKWKSEDPSDMGIMQLIKVKTSGIACIPVHIKRSRASSFIQPGDEPSEEDNPNSGQHGINIFFK